jgi:hypothetical protein
MRGRRARNQDCTEYDEHETGPNARSMATTDVQKIDFTLLTAKKGSGYSSEITANNTT